MVKKSLKITNFFFVPNSRKKKRNRLKKDTAPNVRCKGAWVLDGRDALRALTQEGEAL
jgi:hypothetical protein